MAIELKMPALSPTMEEGTLAKWLVKPGDTVKSGDILVSIDGRWTTSLSDTYKAAEAVEPEKSVTVVVSRDGKEVTLTVTPKEGI